MFQTFTKSYIVMLLSCYSTQQAAMFGSNVVELWFATPRYSVCLIRQLWYMKQLRQQRLQCNVFTTLADRTAEGLPIMSTSTGETKLDAAGKSSGGLEC